MDLGLTGKKAIVTGGSQGIGLETARLLAQEGADVHICARRSAKLDEALQVLHGMPGTVTGTPCDVADGSAYNRWLAAAQDHLGGVDIFVSNASAGVGEHTSEGAWSANLSVDMLGLVRGAEAVMVPMARRGGGAIIAVSSMAGLEAMAPPTAYAAIKSAMITYAKQLSLQTMAHGIRVNSVSPGPILVESGSWDHARVQAPEAYQQTLARQPSGRLGTPQEVAQAIVWLASKRASWVTGTNLIVDGGFTARTQF